MSTQRICPHGHAYEVSGPADTGGCPICAGTVAINPDPVLPANQRPDAEPGEVRPCDTVEVPPHSHQDTDVTVESEGIEVVDDDITDARGTRAETSLAGEGEPAVQDELKVPGYQILKELGRGGMGVVYKARDVNLNRVVALKTILTGPFVGPGELARFQTEAEAEARLRHPNIVQIYDVGEHEGRPYFTMELVEGGSLTDLLEEGPLEPGKAAALVQTLARAMEHAHRHDVLHRDLKPGNILLGQEGQAKIADFGLAKKLDAEYGQTRSGSILGTPSYMAPEQAGARKQEIGPHTDVYALGTILYECLTGRPPFRSDNQLDTLMQVLSDEVCPPRQVRRHIPRDLENICLKCLEKQPAKRYTAQELADDLGRYLAGEPVRVRRAPLWERSIRWVARHPLSTTFLLLLLVGMGVLGWLLFPGAYRLATNQGVLAFQSTESDLSVQVLQDGKEVAQLDLRDGKDFNLPAGAYTLALSREAAHLEVIPRWITLERNQRLVVHVQNRTVGKVLELTGAGEPKRGLAFSADGRYVVAGGPLPGIGGQGSETQHTLFVWDLATGEMLTQFPTRKEPVRDLVLLPAGAAGRVAPGVRSSSPDPPASRGTLASPHTPLAQLPLVLAAHDDGSLALWDVHSPEPLRTFSPPGERVGRARCLAISPDHRLALSGHSDGSVRLWDVETGQLKDLLDRHENSVTCVAFSPDGRLALSGSKDTMMYLWDLSEGDPVAARGTPASPHTPLVREFRAHATEVLDAVFSRDGKQVLSASRGGMLLLWDTQTGRLLRRFRGHSGAVTSVALSPDGKWAVSGSSDRTVRIWEVASGQEMYTFQGHQDGITALAFSPDGRQVLSAGGVNWQPLRGEEPKRYKNGQLFRRVFGGEAEGIWVKGNDYAIRLWGVPFDLPEQGILANSATTSRVAMTREVAHLTLPPPEGDQPEPVQYLAASPDGRWAVTSNRGMRLWEWSKPARGPGRFHMRAYYPDSRGTVRLAAFSADGQFLVSVRGSSGLECREVATGKVLMRRGSTWSAPQDQVHALALVNGAAGEAPRWIVVGNEKNTVQLLKSQGEEVAPETLRGHQGPVRAVAVSPDGKQILSGSDDRTVRVWDLGEKRELMRFEGHQGPVLAVAFTPDGQYALSASEDKLIRLWDLQTGTERLRFRGHGSPVEHLSAWTVNEDGPRSTVHAGQLVLSADRDGQVLGWNLRTRRPHLICETRGEPLVSLASLPDGRFLTASTKAGARLWAPLKRGQQPPPLLSDLPLPPDPLELARFLGHSHAVAAVAFSPDGRQVFSVGSAKYVNGHFRWGADTYLRLWDVQNKKAIHHWIGHRAPTMSVVYLPDGQHALTGGADATVRLWNLATYQEERSYTGHTKEVRRVVCSPDGKRLASAGRDGKVCIWNVDSSAPLHTIVQGEEQNDEVWCVAFSPDGKTLLYGTAGGTVQIVDVETGERGLSWKAQGGRVRNVVFSPDGQQVWTSGWGGQARRWDPRTGKQLPGTFHQPRAILTMAISPDGKRAATGGLEGRVRLWDLSASGDIEQTPTFPLLYEYQRQGELIHGVTFSPDGKLLATAGFDRTVRVLKVPEHPAAPEEETAEVEIRCEDPRARVELRQQGKPVHGPTAERLLSLKPGRYQVVVHPGEERKPESDLLLRSWVGHFSVKPGQRYSLHVRWVREPERSPEHVKAIVGHTDIVRGLDVSPDGQQVLTTSWDSTICLWDLDKGIQIRRFEGNRGSHHSIVYSPDGKTALSGGDYKEMILWEVATGRELRRFVGHEGNIWNVSFSADGKWALSTSPDRTIRLWEVATGKQLKVFKGHTAAVECASLSPDSRLIISGGYDRTIRLWDVETESVLHTFAVQEHLYSAFFSPDGSQILTASSTGNVRLFDVATREQVQLFRGHADQVMCARFSPDGKYVLTTGKDGKMFLWDRVSGKQVHEFTGHGSGIAYAAFSADGQRIVSAGGQWTKTRTPWTAGTDFALHVWKMPAVK